MTSEQSTSEKVDVEKQHKPKNIKVKKKKKLILVETIKNKDISSKKSIGEMKVMKLKNDKEIIIDLFNKNVRGKKFYKDKNTEHCGDEGHWLEKQMSIMPNSKNSPDKLGYEQKKDSNKITFGDWGASIYIQ